MRRANYISIGVAALVLLLPVITIHARQDASHRIGVHVVSGEGKFYDTVSGGAFVPRGVNYLYFVRVAGHDEDWTLATNVFDPERIRDDFQQLAARGYNTVRLFFDHCANGPTCITHVGQVGLNDAYLDNLAELTRIAAETGIYLILTSNDIPDGGGYGELANRDSSALMAGYRNTHFLAASGVEAAVRYWGDIMAGLRQRDTAWSAVLGWSLVNEQWIFKAQPPWSLRGGTVRNSTGQTYDMSSPTQRRAMVADAVTHYIAALVDVIKQADPDALVTMGFFVPQFPNPTDVGGSWYVDTAPLMASAPLDFFDFHTYTGSSLTIAQVAQNFGMPDHPEKPVIMGETGSFKSITPSAAEALRLMLAWRADSCTAGFDGWLHWDYYPIPDALGDATWALLDADGLLLDALSPQQTPDPCAAGEGQGDFNAAYHRPVRVSSALPDAPGARAVDGTEAGWSSGQSAPGDIEIDLGEPRTVRQVILHVDQYPAGRTHHQVWAILTDRSPVLIGDLVGQTRGGQTLTVTPPTPIGNVIAVRVETLESPSWVAWSEIEVIAS